VAKATKAKQNKELFNAYILAISIRGVWNAIMKNRFYPEKYYDHRIVDQAGSTIGHIRVKPSGILGAPKDAKVWYGLPLSRFAKFCEEYGNKQKK
jgi:hypothetical protein